MKTETSEWMVADTDSPLEINLDNGAKIRIWARACGVVQCELKAEITEPDHDEQERP